MADANVLPMHEDFARWYGEVSLDNDQVRRQARWEGISIIVRDADWNMVETLLRLAYRGRPAPATVLAIRQAFKSADDTFEMSGNDRELQVLAGACLAVLMEQDEDAGAAAALAVTTAGLGGARKPGLPMDLAVLGEAAITHWGDVNRKRPSVAAYTPIGLPKFDFAKAATKVSEESSWESVSAAFTLAADSAGAAMNQLAQRQANAVRTIEHFVRVQDEELQMLWWLMGQRSSVYDCAFDAVPADVQPLVFASELANSTKFLPGPPSIKAILSRAGLKERKKVSITAAVNAADSDWLQELLGEADPSPISTPLHAAIKRQLDTGAGEAWIAGWAASTGCSATSTLSGLALGNFFYRERLLLLFR
ncbi:GTPase-associated system all-helical protein GASH [Azotobacter beijerinckii]|uniref:GTPase-associated system helical domain-containing protein n=1 Tax=Azotobacter beijerinckii TaxID=170623 RepID=A0A1I1CEE8_9GAMM|nr:GTPase-associated system all-helical protein GASH [Azotobacter beijerinckii]SFB61055.1 hypothetical protein SAMN04244571_04257 [Azotobacter beijerinckii]